MINSSILAGLSSVGATLAQFLQERRGRAERASSETLDEYKEWLHRQRHKEVLNALADREGLERAIMLTLQETVNCVERSASKLQQDLNGRIAEYVEAIQFESGWLSTTPRSARPHRLIGLIGRDSALAQLEAHDNNDCVIVGQPGSGKTYLAAEFIRSTGDGFFVYHGGTGSLSRAIKAAKPRFLVVDDAGDNDTTIGALRQIRAESGVPFSIIAICWPSERDRVALWLQRPASSSLQLELLTRDEIVEVVKASGLRGPQALIRAIVDQAEGKPGLAVVLTDLCLKGGHEDVWNGKVLASAVRSWFEPVVGKRAITALAAFSFGGDGGMQVEDIAECTGIPKAELLSTLKDLAGAGVLHEVSLTHLSVRPEPLRYVLMKDHYFTGPCGDNPRPLLEKIPQPCDRANVLIGVRQYGGHVENSLLMESLSQVQPFSAWHSKPDPWESYAYLGKDEAIDAFNRFPDQLCQFADPFLHYIAELAIPRLLTLDARITHTNTFELTPLKIIEDWIRRAQRGSEEAVARRATLLEALIKWLNQGGSVKSGVAAMAIAFSPTFDCSTVDPGIGRTVSIYRGALAPDQLVQVGQHWSKARDCLSTLDIKDWGPLLSLLDRWAAPEWDLRLVKTNKAGRAFKREVRQAMLATAKRMCADLATLAPRHPGVNHRLSKFADTLIAASALQLDPHFEALVYHAGWTEGYEGRLKAHQNVVVGIASEWARGLPRSFACRIARHHSAATSAGVGCGAWVRVLCSEIARLVGNCLPWVDALIEGGCPCDAIMPFVHEAIDTEQGCLVALLTRCLSYRATEASTMAVVLRMQNPPDHLLQDVLSRLGDDRHSVTIRFVCGESPIPTMHKLLRHPCARIAGQAAEAEWHTGERGSIRGELKKDWRMAVVQSLEDDHTLSNIFEVHSDLAFEWLLRRVSGDGAQWYRFETALPVAGRVLSPKKRIDLLSQLPEKGSTDQIIQSLVGYDAKVYRAYLAHLDKKPPCLLPLRRPRCESIGFHADGWMELAHVALELGADPHDIAFAALYPGGVYGDGVEVWRERLSWYQELASHTDADIRIVGAEGMKLAKENVDAAEAEEKHIAIHGLR